MLTIVKNPGNIHLHVPGILHSFSPLNNTVRSIIMIFFHLFINLFNSLLLPLYKVLTAR